MDSDVEFELHFLDCQPSSVLHAFSSERIVDHLYRAATTRILRDEPNPSDRVTDIDELILLDPFFIFPRPTQTKEIPIEFVQEEKRPSPISLRPAAPKAEEVSHIPPAPPFPATFDPPPSSSSKSQCQTPDRESLWATIENQNVAEYVDQCNASTTKRMRRDVDRKSH